MAASTEQFSLGFKVKCFNLSGTLAVCAVDSGGRANESGLMTGVNRSAERSEG